MNGYLHVMAALGNVAQGISKYFRNEEWPCDLGARPHQGHRSELAGGRMYVGDEPVDYNIHVTIHAFSELVTIMKDHYPFPCRLGRVCP